MSNQELLKQAQPGIADQGLAAKVAKVVDGNVAVEQSASVVQRGSAGVINLSDSYDLVKGSFLAKSTNSAIESISTQGQLVLGALKSVSS